MSKYAVMPKADYVDICDAIRDKAGGIQSIKSGEMPAKIEEVYNEGLDSGYRDGWDFGESSGTHDGFEVGVGFGEDTKSVVVFSGYESGSFGGTYNIAFDNPKQLIVTASAECVFDAFELTEAGGTTHTLDVSVLNAETRIIDISDFVCNADKGYGTLYLSGSCADYGIVGVSVTNKLGYAEGVEDGKQAEHEAFLAKYQEYDNCEYLFAGVGWKKETFYPTKNIVPTRAIGTFYSFSAVSGGQLDFVERLKECGVILDFSKCTVMERTFYSASIGRLGVIDCTACTYTLSHLFSYSTIHTIEKWIVCENNKYSYCFHGQGHLENITVEGTIADNDIDVHWATKLTHDSLMSFIKALKDFSGTSTTMSITFGATNLAKLTDAEKAIATQKGWTLA